MTIELTPDEVQIIIWELQQAARARYKAQPKYSRSCIELTRKLTKAVEKEQS